MFLPVDTHDRIGIVGTLSRRPKERAKFFEKQLPALEWYDMSANFDDAKAFTKRRKQ